MCVCVCRKCATTQCYEIHPVGRGVGTAGPGSFEKHATGNGSIITHWNTFGNGFRQKRKTFRFRQTRGSVPSSTVVCRRERAQETSNRRDGYQGFYRRAPNTNDPDGIIGESQDRQQPTRIYYTRLGLVLLGYILCNV